MSEYKYGIVLSGGGARGFAHMGALKAFNEFEIQFDVISGVSAGAIVGAFFADGYSPEEIFEIFGEKKLTHLSSFRIPGKGLLRNTGLLRVLKDNLRSKNIEDLKIPLHIAATNLNRGEIEYFNKGPVIPSILASSSIPVLFNPTIINGYNYADGGIMNNFPVKPIRKDTDIVFGVLINPRRYEKEISSLLDVAIRSYHLAIKANQVSGIWGCDILIEPHELEEYGIFEASRSKEIFDIGYKETKKILEKEKGELQNF